MDNILARTAQFQPAARARRFFCFFLKAARFRAVFLRFFTRMAVSYRPEGRGALGDVRYHSPPAPRRTIVRSVTGIQSVRRNSTVAAAIAPTAKTTRNARSSDTAPWI